MANIMKTHFKAQVEHLVETWADQSEDAIRNLVVGGVLIGYDAKDGEEVWNSLKEAVDCYGAKNARAELIAAATAQFEKVITSALKRESGKKKVVG